MNKYIIYSLLILSAGMSACDNKAAIAPSLALSHFREYCELTGGIVPDEEDTENICQCGAQKCYNRGCNKDGNDCEKNELCDENGTPVYEEKNKICIEKRCQNGVYAEKICSGNVPCAYNDGVPVGCGECVDGTNDCDGNKIIYCENGREIEEDCGDRQCDKGRCVENKIYKEDDGVCKEYLFKDGGYNEVNDCPNNVSCRHDEDGNLTCGECKNNSNVICRIDESGEAQLEQCSYGNSIKTPCGNLHFCYNNKCAECDVNNTDATYREIGGRCVAYECIEGFWKEITDERKCTDDVSCKKNDSGRNVGCGDCYNNSGYRCISGTDGNKAEERYCNNGEINTKECSSSDCSGDYCSECNDSDMSCTNGTNGGILRKCRDKSPIETMCKNGDKNVSCKGNGIDCGECLNEDFRCSNGIVQICKSGSWTEYKEYINEHGCVMYDGHTYYCKDNTTKKVSECAKTCLYNHCVENNQGVVSYDSDQEAIVRRTPSTSGTTGTVYGQKHYVGYLNKNAVVNVVGKAGKRDDLFLVKFTENDLKSLNKYDNKNISYNEYWNGDNERYYYVESKFIKTLVKNKTDKTFFSTPPNLEIKMVDGENTKSLAVDYDGIERKTANAAFKYVLNKMGASGPDIDDDSKNMKSLVIYLSQHNKHKMFNVEMYANDQFLCVQDPNVWDWYQWQQSDDETISGYALIRKLAAFFESTKDKESYIIARVGCETKKPVDNLTENLFFGFWGPYHYVVIYGYDPNNTIKYNEPYNGRTEEKGFFYIKDTLNGKFTIDTTNLEPVIKKAIDQNNTHEYSPHYGMYGAERLVQQSNRLFFFTKK